MQQDIKAEDFIVTEKDGSRWINHDLLKEYGLFSLPKPIMRSALMVYFENARRHSHQAAHWVNTFIGLTNAISRYPRAVAINFTRGPAYKRNMDYLGRFSK